MVSLIPWVRRWLVFFGGVEEVRVNSRLIHLLQTRTHNGGIVEGLNLRGVGYIGLA